MEHAIDLDREPLTAVATRECGVAIHLLTTIGDFAACVEIQRAVWGWADLDIMPVRLFVLMQHVGGLVLGAYDAGELVGFVNCVPGIQDGQAFWHSHMMAVLPDYRDRGIGTALKLAQRAHALDRGIHSLQWVFDPLEAKNAYLNIAKLSAIVRRYSINHYGASTSRLHAGLDSDRLIAEWQLAGPKVAVRSGETRKVPVPADVQALRRVDLPAVRALQLAVREQFLRNLSDRFVVVGCERHSDRCEYVFQREGEGGRGQS